MKAKQLYFVLIAAVVLGLASFVGIGYGADKLMGMQAKKLSKLRADSAALDTVQVSLTKNKKDIAQYSELNAIAKSIVPQDKDQAQAVREIVNLAAQSGIAKLTSITFPVSTLGNGGAGATNPDLTQLTPVKGISGVYELPITITQATTDSVPYSQFVTFLGKLEKNRRTAQVNGITIDPDDTHPGRIAFVLTIKEFIKP